MSLIYLISAYRQPQQLARLVTRLQQPGVRFLIHVDGRVAIEPFTDALPERANVQFVRDRQRVYWKGFSQVRMMLALLRAAQTLPFSYAIYLSEADYPLRTNSAINHFFEQQPPELISYWTFTDRPRWGHKLRYYYFHDTPWINPRQSQVSYRLFRLYNRSVKYLLPRRTPPRGPIPYGGSEYFSLSHQAITYLIDSVNRHPSRLRWYQYSDSPIEHFFHTILLNAPFRNRIIHVDDYQQWSQQLTASERAASAEMLPEQAFHFRYMDWSGLDGSGLDGSDLGSRERPAVLDERDFTALTTTNALFARKFDGDRSAVLLDRLDQWLNTNPSASRLPLFC